MNKAWTYIKSILVPVIIGGITGLIISKFIDYNVLQKPPLAPPSVLFPIVWTILYVLMGVSYGILKIFLKKYEKDEIKKLSVYKALKTFFGFSGFIPIYTGSSDSR